MSTEVATGAVHLITAQPTPDPFQYDSLIALGYQPESWDGFYRVPAITQPVQWMSPTSALVAEVVTLDPDHKIGARDRRGRERIHWVHRTGRRPAHA